MNIKIDWPFLKPSAHGPKSAFRSSKGWVIFNAAGYIEPMAYWLLKSEPDVFGYMDLERVGKEPWNGVRNYQARNHLRAMQEGAQSLIASVFQSHTASV